MRYSVVFFTHSSQETSAAVKQHSKICEEEKKKELTKLNVPVIFISEGVSNTQIPFLMEGMLPFLHKHWIQPQLLTV